MVPVSEEHGSWNSMGSIRRLDGLRIDTSDEGILLPHQPRIAAALQAHIGATIQVRKRLKRTVLRQTQAGRRMHSKRYGFPQPRMRGSGVRRGRYSLGVGLRPSRHPEPNTERQVNLVVLSSCERDSRGRHRAMAIAAGTAAGPRRSVGAERRL